MKSKKYKNPIFNFLKGMTELKKDFDFSLPEINKDYSQYQLNRYLSMIRIFLPLVVMVNRLGNISNKTHYEFFKSKLPKRNYFFSYIKKEKEINEHEVGCISRYYEVSIREAKMYIKMLTKEQVKQITNKFRHGLI